MSKSTLAGLAILMAGAITGFSQSPGLGLNFAATDPNEATSSLLPEEFAGVLPQANWNNLSGATGTNVSGLSYDQSGTAVSSSASVTWSSPNTWSSGGNNLFAGSDAKLLSGYLDTQDTAETGISISVENLDPAIVGEGYDVYVYFVSDSPENRGGAYTIDPGTGPIVKYGSSMATPLEYVEDPGTDADLSQDGNYLKFTGLTGTSFTLTTDTTQTTPNGFRAPVNAIQIVPTVPFGPDFISQPGDVMVYSGRTATFTAVAEGFPAITDLQWRKDGVDLVASARITGVNSSTLVINDVTSADAGAYTLAATSSRGSESSEAATLAISTEDGSAYESAIIDANPVAFWRLNEEASSDQLFDFIGGLRGQYQPAVLHGDSVPGPQSPEFPAFSSANSAALFDGFTYATTETPELNANTVSFVTWINPNWAQTDFTGLFMTRSGTQAGLGYTTDNQLGYTWNNNSTWSWNSGLRPPDGQWSMVVLSIEAGRATLYLASEGTISASINPVAHTAEAWGGEARIGDDSGGTPRAFAGSIDEVAIFDRSLSFQEVADLYELATGIPQEVPPSVSPHPQSTTRYAGADVVFQSGAAGADVTLQWQKDGADLTNNDRVSGVTSEILAIDNITAADAGDYTLVASNPVGDSVSDAATLTVLQPEHEYASEIIALDPLAYYRLNETGDVSLGTLPAADFWGGRDGVWAPFALNSVEGPRPSSGYGGFEADNTGLLPTLSFADSWVTVPGPSVTTDTLTILAWIRPVSLVPNGGIVFARAGQPATALNLNGAGNLGYHWLDAAATYSFDSGLTPPLNQWSLVAVVVEPDQATLHMINPTGAQSAVNTAAHAPRAFTDDIRIGGDPNNVNRNFDGTIDEVAIFDHALTGAEIEALYQQALGIIAPSIAVHPASREAFPGVTTSFTVAASGTDPLTYQWQKQDGGVFADLADGGNISGAETETLTLSNISATDAGDYRVVVSNAQGSATSNPASLTLLTAPPQPGVGTFGAAVIASGAESLWRLNETGDPATGTLQAYDYAGMNHGLYGVAAMNGLHGIAGPRPFDGFDQFEAGNTALSSSSNLADSWVTVPGPGFTTDTLTILAWINPNFLAPNAGIVFARAGQPATGLNLNAEGALGYHWLDTQASYGWDSGLTPVPGQWSLAALVVEPDQATLHLIDATGTQTAVNSTNHAPRAFTDSIRIGGDPSSVDRTFAGVIDEVAIFNRALSIADIEAIHAGETAAAPAQLAITGDRAQVTITWEGTGTLQSTTALEGPSTVWEEVVTTGNTHATEPEDAARFYRLVE